MSPRRRAGRVVRSPEDLAWLISDTVLDHLGTVEAVVPITEVTALIRARDAEVAEQVRAETLAGFEREDHAPFVGYLDTEPGYWRLVGPKHYKPLPPEPTAEEIAVVKRWMAGGEP